MADSREAQATHFTIFTAAQDRKTFESNCEDRGEEWEEECRCGKVGEDGVVGELEQELEISKPEKVQLPDVAAGMQCEPGQ